MRWSYFLIAFIALMIWDMHSHRGRYGHMVLAAVDDVSDLVNLKLDLGR